MNDIATQSGVREGNVRKAPRPRGRPPKQREPRRRKIIAAAADLFIANGYSRTTLEAVAKHAGLNKRAIYELVGDKEQLFRAVCEQASTINELDFSADIDKGSLHNSLMSLGKRLLEHSLSDRTLGLGNMVITESRQFPELIEDIVAANYLEANKRVSEYLSTLQDLGMIRIDDKLHSSELFFDMIVGQLVYRKSLGQSRFDPGEDYLAQRVDLFIRCHLPPDEPGDKGSS